MEQRWFLVYDDAEETLIGEFEDRPDDDLIQTARRRQPRLGVVLRRGKSAVEWILVETWDPLVTPPRPPFRSWQR